MAGLVQSSRAIGRQMLSSIPLDVRPCAATPPSRRQLAVQSSSLVKQLVLATAATAAIGATVILVKQRNEEQQQLGGAQRRRRQRDAGSSSSGSDSAGGGRSWLPELPRGLGLGWALQDKDKQLAGQVQEIDRKRHREAQRELAAWDRRWGLRSKPLTELRALAQQHRIAGRSRMRKQELVAALEVALGFVAPTHGEAAAGGAAAAQQQQQQRQQQQRLGDP